MPEVSAALESFVLLANGAKGGAAVSLLKQVLEAPGVYVFGELLDHPNISILETEHADGPAVLKLARIFAYGTYEDYWSEKNSVPVLSDLSEAMTKKLRLLTVASLATKFKLIRYAELQKQLRINNVRELEDLIIEGTNAGVLRGKLDQKNSHFEVEYAMGRDLKQSDLSSIQETLRAWSECCDGMLACLEHQVNRANKLKSDNSNHKKDVEAKVLEIRNQLKAQQQLSDGPDDPDSRMETDRERRDKKGGKGKSSAPRVGLCLSRSRYN